MYRQDIKLERTGKVKEGEEGKTDWRGGCRNVDSKDIQGRFTIHPAPGHLTSTAFVVLSGVKRWEERI